MGYQFRSTLCLTFLAVLSFFAAAEPVQIFHKNIERQLGGTTTNALSVLQAALATFSSTAVPTTTAGEAAATTTGEAPAATTTDSGPQQANIRVDVAQPSLCSESALQFSSAYSVPTGTIVIQTETGWGDLGSIWNISANDGVKISDMHMPCQGSACTGITGNTETDGSIVENPDGSWSVYPVVPLMIFNLHPTGQ